MNKMMAMIVANQIVHMNGLDVGLVPEYARLIDRGVVSLNMCGLDEFRLPTVICPSVKLLALRHNALSTLPQGLCKIFPALEFLHVPGNRLETLPDLSGCAQTLRSLDCSHNRLRTTPAVHELHSLGELDLGGQYVGDVPHWVGKMPHLRILRVFADGLPDMSRSPVTRIEIESKSFVPNALLAPGVRVLEYRIEAWRDDDIVGALTDMSSDVSRRCEISFTSTPNAGLYRRFVRLIRGAGIKNLNVAFGARGGIQVQPF